MSSKVKRAAGGQHKTMGRGVAGGTAEPAGQNKKRQTVLAAAVALAVCFLVGAGLFSAFGSGGTGGTYADIEIRNYGTVTIKLDEKAAPITTENFVKLAKSGFYDGLTFHRIMEGFMMQGGDPNGNGTGGAEESIVGEFSANGYKNDLSHTRGAVSMARSNDYNSASSQFFIVHEDSTFLDGQYAVFGYVTEGMDIVDTICGTAKPIDNNGTIPAEEQPVITAVVIRNEN